MNQINPIKSVKRLFCTIIFTAFCTMTIWAGTWEQQEQGGYRYKNDDGTYLTNTWLQENGKWYFFDENGLLVVDTTIEGYQVGTDGAEISGAAAITSQYPQVLIPAVTQQESQTAQATVGEQKIPETTAAATTTVTYVLNKNTKKFHKPSCSSVSDMAAKNRMDSGSSRDEVIAQGYVPCKRCKP